MQGNNFSNAQDTALTQKFIEKVNETNYSISP